MYGPSNITSAAHLLQLQCYTVMLSNEHGLSMMVHLSLALQLATTHAPCACPSLMAL